jgi:hypothetical protein
MRMAVQPDFSATPTNLEFIARAVDTITTEAIAKIA